MERNRFEKLSLSPRSCSTLHKHPSFPSPGPKLPSSESLGHLAGALWVSTCSFRMRAVAGSVPQERIVPLGAIGSYPAECPDCSLGLRNQPVGRAAVPLVGCVPEGKSCDFSARDSCVYLKTRLEHLGHPLLSVH